MGTIRNLLGTLGRMRFQPENAAPIVVLGNQKSGTSAIASLLAKATGLSYQIDMPEFWGDAFKRMRGNRHRIRSAMRQCHREFSKGLVKEPNLTFLYPDLKSLMPHATFVFVVREPTQNIRSIAEKLKLSASDLMAGPEATAGLSEGWLGVFDDHELYGEAAIESPRGLILAQRWKIAADVYLNSPDDFELIRFEDFAADKLGSISSLASSLGLQVTHDISDQVDIAYQPRGKKELVVPAELVAGYAPGLESHAKRFGYSLEQATRRSA